MRIEKTCLVKAPVDAVWKTLLDPDRLAACVPGVERVEVVDDTRFLVHVAVKVGIVSARFKLRVTVVEARPPRFITHSIAEAVLLSESIIVMGPNGRGLDELAVGVSRPRAGRDDALFQVERRVRALTSKWWVEPEASARDPIGEKR